MIDKRSVSSASPFEAKFGFCRARRIDRVVHVAGTAPIGPDGKTFGVGDPAAQARRCFDIAKEALQALDADISDVVRTRMFLTRIDDWEVIGAVHGEYFGDVRPVSTMVEVSRLIDPDWRIEIEVEALIGAGG